MEFIMEYFKRRESRVPQKVYIRKIKKKFSPTKTIQDNKIQKHATV